MHFIILQISLNVVVCLCDGVRVLGGSVGCESVCLRLCPVWPLSVKVESSAEAYGKPQPSPRYSTTEAHAPEKPSETFYQYFFFNLAHTSSTLLPHSSYSQVHGSSIICDPFIQRYKLMLNFQNSCVFTTCSGSRPICSVHSGLGLVKKGKVAN